MKKIDLTRIFFTLISLIVLVIGFTFPTNNKITGFFVFLVIISLIIFDIQAPKIAKLSEDNPKIKTMRNLNRLNIFIVSICLLFFIISPIKTTFSEKTNELIVVGLFSIFIMIFGNVSPKIPFNRYLGLRLPWTVRDEDTWKIAHKILGYLAFPVAIIQFILTFFFSVKSVTLACVLFWIIIPGLYSLYFYYKKFNIN